MKLISPCIQEKSADAPISESQEKTNASVNESVGEHEDVDNLTLSQIEMEYLLDAPQKTSTPEKESE